MEFIILIICVLFELFRHTNFSSIAEPQNVEDFFTFVVKLILKHESLDIYAKNSLQRVIEGYKLAQTTKKFYLLCTSSAITIRMQHFQNK